jgi:WD40 repeat protein
MARTGRAGPPFTLSEVEGCRTQVHSRVRCSRQASTSLSLNGRFVRAIVTVLVLTSCATLPKTSPEVLAQLRATPHAFVGGTPAALGKPVVLNREDFVFDAQPSPDGKVVAFSRLGVKDFFLAAWSVGAEPAKRFDVSVGPSEFDVEQLAFSPKGDVVAAASRDAVLRVFDAKSGQLVGAWPAEEPLVSVAFDASGTRLVAGGAKGQVTVLAWPGLTWVAEARAHAGEVRGLAWA